MKRAALLDGLDRATDSATVYAIQRGLPLAINKKSTIIGSLLIQKNDDNLYDILDSDKNVLFKNISGYDVAVIISQRYNSGERAIIKEVLDLEHRFVKFHTDMIHYLHCMKNAKKKDSLRLAILEDKFQIAEAYARSIKDKIASFKRLK